jgi:hypothetical protein
MHPPASPEGEADGRQGLGNHLIPICVNLQSEILNLQLHPFVTFTVESFWPLSLCQPPLSSLFTLGMFAQPVATKRTTLGKPVVAHSA